MKLALAAVQDRTAGFRFATSNVIETHSATFCLDVSFIVKHFNDRWQFCLPSLGPQGLWVILVVKNSPSVVAHRTVVVYLNKLCLLPHFHFSFFVVDVITYGLDVVVIFVDNGRPFCCGWQLCSPRHQRFCCHSDVILDEISRASGLNGVLNCRLASGRSSNF